MDLAIKSQSFKTFLRVQFSSFTGSMFDFALMIFLTEMFHIYYVISASLGAILGAVVNFNINRYWAFNLKMRFFGRASIRMTCTQVHSGHPDMNSIQNVA